MDTKPSADFKRGYKITDFRRLKRFGWSPPEIFVPEGKELSDLTDEELIKQTQHLIEKNDPDLLVFFKKQKINFTKVIKLLLISLKEADSTARYLLARDHRRPVQKQIKILRKMKYQDETFERHLERLNNFYEGIKKALATKKKINPRMLTIKDPSKWPIFTQLIIDLYKLLEPKVDYRLPPIKRVTEVPYKEEAFEAIARILQAWWPTFFKKINSKRVKSRIQANLDHP